MRLAGGTGDGQGVKVRGEDLENNQNLFSAFCRVGSEDRQ